jgi:membrane-associated phospholipid phosphatase
MRRSILLASGCLALSLGVSPAWAGQPISLEPATPASRALKLESTEATPTPARSEHPGGSITVPRFTRRDLAFALVTAGVVSATVPSDVWIAGEAGESRSPGEHTLARAAEHFGNVAVVFPALAVAWCAERAAGRRGAAGAIGRTAIATAAAGIGALALKEIAGRSRPSEAPADMDDLHPFSGHASFPSGHTTIAFALATAIDAETSTRWAWIAYPVAGLVAWSRVHDGEHWTSDVVAGAALGVWSSRKAEAALRQEDRSPGFRLGFSSGAGTPGIALTFGS